eukprot:CAMPEP_0113511796 /NCGR_PEP_ID=MMETSP0014_2-20120614/38956_1 /TAXON_ID=2857 /ORGANISM="Nitzschia sp." /LENGTH=188 /DNA_ID=CAMNT_0000408029 /DNA_START=101 /DNA_END=667 /DNA_ORIENTATION=- /assembly_acc=CAM_ASM_000159
MEKLQLLVWDEKHARRPRIRVVFDDLETEEQSSLFLTSPKASWTESLKTLVESAWAHSISARPTMAQMEVELKRQLTSGIEHMDSFHGGMSDTLLDNKRLSQNRRRSTFVYQPHSITEDEPAANSTTQDAKILAWFGGSTRRLFSPRSVLNLRSHRNITSSPSFAQRKSHGSRGATTAVEEELADFSE